MTRKKSKMYFGIFNNYKTLFSKDFAQKKYNRINIGPTFMFTRVNKTCSECTELLQSKFLWLTLL